MNKKLNKGLLVLLGSFSGLLFTLTGVFGISAYSAEGTEDLNFPLSFGNGTGSLGNIGVGNRKNIATELSGNLELLSLKKP